MTPRQVHLKTRAALRLARQLRNACDAASEAIDAKHGSHTDIAASMRRTCDAASLTLGLVADVFCQTGDHLLKGVS